MSEYDVTKRSEDYRIGGTVLAEALIEEGVTDMFGIPGGTSDTVFEEGHGVLKGYVVRHEQTAAYAADAYARCLRKPGVCYTSNSPGAANAFPGMMHARSTNSPVILLAGGSNPATDNIRNSQQMDVSPADSMQGICKLSKRLNDIRTTSYWVRKTFQEAMAPVQGPCCLEVPCSFTQQIDDGKNLKQRLYKPGKPAPIPGCSGDPFYVQKAVELLLAAERPLIICGDDAYWSDAAAELQELAEFLHVPVSGKRTARGILPEDSLYGCSPSVAGTLTGNADVICLIGHCVSGIDNWFDAPSRGAKYIQIAPNASEIWLNIPAEVNIVASSKQVVRQMIECAMDLAPNGRQHPEWIEAVTAAKMNTAAFLQKANARNHGKTPMHTNVICEAIGQIMDSSSTLIYDSLSASSFLTQQVNTQYAGQVLDAGTFQTLGHSIGMCIGAQVARPGRQVMSVIGDGGFGIAGMDMETMARYNLPAVIVMINNSSWGGRCWAPDLYYPKMPSQSMLPNMRYDIAFKEFGCYTELVTEDAQMLPALERAFNSGKPALINCIAETDVLHPVRKSANLGNIVVNRNVSTLPKEALKELATYKPKDLYKAKATAEIGMDVDLPLEDFEAVINYAKEHCND